MGDAPEGAPTAPFQKLPRKAQHVLARLRGSVSGVGRALFPDFATWLGDDELLDRCIQLEKLAGEAHLSSAVREDFEHAARTRGERAYLEKLARPSLPQQGRLDELRREERTLEGSPKGRTRRRIADRIERILPVAYRRELDTVFREILREFWGIAVPSLTPAWRDAVRFWLVVDDNRELRSVFGTVLREAPPATVVKVYDSLGDALSAALFLRTFRRQPLARQAAIREAATKLDLTSDRRRTFFAWMMTSLTTARKHGRLRRAVASSIEPE